MVYNANGLYPHKAQISNKVNSSALSNKGKLACLGCIFKKFPDVFHMHPFTDRTNSFGAGIVIHSMGGSPLICVLAKNCHYQIPIFEESLFELELIYMLSDTPNVGLKIVDCSLFARRILFAEPNQQYLLLNLEREPVQ